MNVLLDTNIVTALDPTSEEFLQETSKAAARVVQLAGRAGIRLFVHPAQDQDFQNDLNERRRAFRQVLAGKYELLTPAPPISARLEGILGSAMVGTNHYVDHQLLAAVDAPAVAYLITEDKQILRKATRAGLRDRVLSIIEAVDAFAALSDQPPSPPPKVRYAKAYELDREDPIWHSFQPDYHGFQDWLEKCSREHRDTWIIDGNQGYATVVIVNREQQIPLSLSGRVLKICSFKNSEKYHGLRYGELMLKTVFSFARENRYDWLFIETFPKQEALINLLEAFGFEKIAEKPNGELMLAKPTKPSEIEPRTGLAFNRRFGPYEVDWSQPLFVVPIKPPFERLLFPERQEQGSLLAGEHAYGNAIRKAYLSYAPIGQIQPGALLLFYRSEDLHAATVLGVTESTLRSSDPEELAQFVARRTVYSIDAIRKMADKSVLAIQFRQARLIDPPIRLHELRSGGILLAAPQSIASVPENAKSWLKARIGQ